MRTNSRELDRRLGEGLRDLYFVVGDEQLLVDEACDAIVAAARGAGFDERSLFEAAPRADWNALFASANNLSLFGGRRLLDVRLPPSGLDRAGSEAVRSYLQAPLPDTLLLLRAVGLEWRQRSSAWYKAIDQAGVVVQTPSVSARELPGWLDERCRRAGLELTPEAIDGLADCVEGNLLAARQEIEKLALLGHAGAIDAEAVRAGVGDSARFGTFELIDAAFAGERTRLPRMLHTVRQEGVAVFLVAAALWSQLRRARELASGGRPRLPRHRQQQLAAAVRRLGAPGIDAALGDCALLDLQAKGMLRGDAWQSLERMLLAIAGSRQRPLAADAALLRLDL